MYLKEKNRSGFVALLLVLIAMFSTGFFVEAPAAQPVTEQEAQAIGVEAYIYGYPMVTMEMTRRVMTNIAAPVGKLAPMGQFAKLRTYPTPADREVTAPQRRHALYTGVDLVNITLVLCSGWMLYDLIEKNDHESRNNVRPRI
jgi:hypothetical protein